MAGTITQFGAGLVLLIVGQAIQASTYYQLRVPEKTLPYCTFMPFDYVDHKIVKKELYNRIDVKQSVEITFSRRWWWDTKPLTGMTIWSPKGVVKATKLSDRKYQYQLSRLKQGQFYELRGVLKYPVKGGLQICVNALSH